MIPNDPIERKKMISRMIFTIIDHGDNLTQWEQDFINSIEDQFNKKETLTDRQCEILEKIYDKL